MDPINMLKADHKNVKELFREFEAAAEGGFKKKQAIAERAFQEIRIHRLLEEQVFYPALRATGNEGAVDMVLDALEEHRVVAGLIEELEGLGAEDEEFDARFRELVENVERHIEEEEEELMPLFRQLLSEDLEDLGAEINELKKQVTTGIFAERPEQG